MIPTYVLAPNCDIPPEGVLALGSILTNPRDPTEMILNEREEAAIAPTLMYTNHKSEFSMSRAELLERRFGIWSTFLASILGFGVDVAVSGHHRDEDVYHCKDLETRFFRPDAKYIALAMGHPAVELYTNEWFSSSVYMITGLKIARGANVETTMERGRGAEFRAGADGTPAGIPIGGGPEVKNDRTKRTKLTFGTNDDFIIGYQLVRIKAKSNGEYRSKPANKYALMHDDDESASIADDWEITMLDETDEAMEDMDIISTIAEMGENCKIFIKASG